MKKKLIVFLMAAVFLLSSVTPAFATSVNDGWSKMPNISLNSNNGAVRGAQWLLKDNGNYHDSIDSNFGPNTKAATKAYQKSKHITIDGCIGPETWAMMRTDVYYYSSTSTNWTYDHLYSNDRWLHRKSGGAWYIYSVKMCS